MIVGIAIDSWKLPIFARRLKADGFAYTKGDGITVDTLFLRVEIDESKVDALKLSVRSANREAANAKTGN